jgi:adenylosuccinate lyase
MQCWETGRDFRDAVAADEEIRKYLSPEQLAETFSVTRQLRNVSRIFERVFGAA